MKQRIITGVLAGAGFLLFLILGGFWFSALVLFMSIIGYKEYIQLNSIKQTHIAALFGYLGVIVLVFPWFELKWIQEANWSFLQFEQVSWLLLFLLFIVTVISKNRFTLDQAALLFFGAIYVGLGFHYMIATVFVENGLYWALLLFCCIWATDSGAYFAGRMFGRKLLWPAISPKKTVEGSIGGILLAIVVACIFSFIDPDILSIGKAVVIAIVISIVGQLGDLIQSAYKRIRGIKDSGSILPGHGGILDRCDSWLIVFPFIHLLNFIP